MIPAHIEDRLLGKQEAERLDNAITKVFTPALQANQYANVVGPYKALMIVGPTNEGWDWALHRYVRSLLIDCDAASRPFKFAWGAEAASDYPLYFARRLLLALCAYLRGEPDCSAALREYSEILYMSFPRDYHRWRVQCRPVGPDPLRSNREWPTIATTQHLDNIVVELSNLLATLLRIAIKNHPYPPIVGVSNVQVLDTLSAKVFAQIISIGQAHGCTFLCQLDDSAGENIRFEAYHPTGLSNSSLKRLFRSTFLQPVSLSAWTDTKSPLRSRDEAIYKSVHGGAPLPVPEVSHSELVGRILETRKNNLTIETLRCLGGDAHTNSQQKAADLMVECAVVGVEPESALSIERNLLLHRVWQLVLKDMANSGLTRPLGKSDLVRKRLTNRLRHANTVTLEPAEPIAVKRCLSFAFDHMERLGYSSHAVAFYDSALSRFSGNRDLMMKAAQIHSVYGSRDVAKQLLGRLRRGCPDLFLKGSIATQLAVVEIKAGRLKGASACLCYVAAILELPASPADRHHELTLLECNARSLLLYRKGALEQAIALLSEVIDTIPSPYSPETSSLVFRALRNLGRAQGKAGVPISQVLHTYRRALLVALSQGGLVGIQNEAAARILLAVTHLKAGSASKASNEFERLMELSNASLRPSDTALCRHAIRLFEDRHYDIWARRWRERLRGIYEKRLLSSARLCAIRDHRGDLD